MNKEEAYKIVYDDIIVNGPNLFQGVYDAKNGNTHFIYGIATVMEYIAIKTGNDEKDWDDFQDLFFKNMEESESKAMQNWVSVDFATPPISKKGKIYSNPVLCVVDNRGLNYNGRPDEASQGKRFIKIARYNTVMERFEVPGTAHRVTHWMLLPELPDEEQEHEEEE